MYLSRSGARLLIGFVYYNLFLFVLNHRICRRYVSLYLHNSFCACIASTAYVMTHTQISKHWECIYTPVVASTGSVRTHRIASTGSVPTLHKIIRLTPERVASFFACYGDIPRPLIIIKIIYTFTTKITFLYHLSSQ